MQTRVQLKAIASFWLLLFWSVAAFAAQQTFVADLRDIPPVAVAISVLLSLIGGSAYTASKLASPNVYVKSPLLEIIKDVLTSIVVGLLIFFLGSYLEWPSVVQAGFITLGGYGGSRVLEPALAMAMKRLSRLFGVDDAVPPTLPAPAPTQDTPQ